MTKPNEVLELLNTLMLCIVDDIVKISKVTLADIRIYLQHALEKIEFLQLESQLKQDQL